MCFKLYIFKDFSFSLCRLIAITMVKSKDTPTLMSVLVHALVSGKHSITTAQYYPCIPLCTIGSNFNHIEI